MTEITFPEASIATVAIVALNAALATGAPIWQTPDIAYYDTGDVPTISMVETSGAEATDAHFADEIASVFAALSEGQEPLGSEFEAVWDANVDRLYES